MDSVRPPPPPTLNQPSTKKNVPTSQVSKVYTKSILVVSGQYFPYAEWIQDSKKEFKKILLTSSEVVHDMSPGDKKLYNLVQGFDNFATNSLVEYTANQLHKEHHFTHVVCLAEEDMIRCSLLREKFAIIGPGEQQSVKSTLLFRDKVWMKQRVQECGIKVPFFAPVDTPLDLLEFVAKHGHHVVVKPRKGYGSVCTAVIKNEQDLESYLRTDFGSSCDAPLEMMVESFVTGQMYHVDGFVYDGEARMIWPSCYVNTVVNFDENPFIAGYSLLPCNPLCLKIQEHVNAVCHALHSVDGPKSYPFHSECWITPEGEIVFCEIASRTGGGGIPTEFDALFGITLRKAHLQFQIGTEVSYKPLEPKWNERFPIVDYSVGWIYIYPKIGKVSLPSLCEQDFCLFYETYAKSGQIYESRKSCADAVCCCIVKGNTETEIVENINKIYEWFNSNCTWESLD